MSYPGQVSKVTPHCVKKAVSRDIANALGFHNFKKQKSKFNISLELDPDDACSQVGVLQLEILTL